MASPPHYAPADLSIDSHGYLHGNGVPLRDGVPLLGAGTSLHGYGASPSPSGPAAIGWQTNEDDDDDDDIERVFGDGGRVIDNPFSSRDDVGEIGVLFGNFGPERRNRRQYEYTRENLKKSPATVIGLQEAAVGIYNVLTSDQPEAWRTAGAPAVAGQADIAGGPLASRPEAKFLAVMGTGDPAPTCLTAVRKSLASDIRR